ncbi:uncharacterized protein LOC128962163 [Oppia nitens]|uniref:uncharacterized protein LOC128962163 n=1 Tax=Oppia nitens TaxID=1686743 RepID=UPI0023DC2CCB|nr:uncharacterized protein LOC128962163 [Oppia nitens]
MCDLTRLTMQSLEASEPQLIPQGQRHYLMMSAAAGIGSGRLPTELRPPSPPLLKVQVSSPPPLQQFISEPLLTTVTTPTHNTYSVANSSRTKICGPMDDILSALGGPQLKSINCLICNEYSPAGHTFRLYSSPRIPPLINHELGIYPFFPFLKKLIAITSKACDERDKDQDCALVCTFCYHSLISQWIAYNASTAIEDRDPMRRTYNCRDYICFICGVTTFRQKVRSIALKYFPFLLEHSRPSGALTLSDGENVVACLTCFDSLTLQWKDYERMKVPIKMRKYNWITVAPTNKGITDGHSTIVHKLPMNDAMSPISPASVTGPGPPSTLLMNATLGLLDSNAINRSSSFASALRKLAKQSNPFDPINSSESEQNGANSSLHLNNESNLAAFRSPFQSTYMRPSPPIVTIAPMAGTSDSLQRSSALCLSMNHSSNSMKNSSLSPFQSSLSNIGAHNQSIGRYMNGLVAPNPPIVTIAPIPAHQVDRNDNLRKRDSHQYYEHRGHTEIPKESIYNSLHRKSPIIRPPTHIIDDNIGSNRVSQQYNGSGFQPYRSLEENLQSSLTSSQLPPHLMPYEGLAIPYPPLPHHLSPISGSIPLSHPSPSPNVSYASYMDRINLLTRGQFHSSSSPWLPVAGSGAVSSVPFNLMRYSDSLNSQTERIIAEDRHHLLNHTLSQSAYKPNEININSPPVHPIIESPHQLHHSLEKMRNERLIVESHNRSEVNVSNHSLNASFVSGLPKEPLDISLHSVNLMDKKDNNDFASANKPLNLSSNCNENVSALHTDKQSLWQHKDNNDKPTNYTINHNQKSNVIFSNSEIKNSVIDSCSKKGVDFDILSNNGLNNKRNEKIVSTIKHLSSNEVNHTNRDLELRTLSNSNKTVLTIDLSKNCNNLRNESITDFNSIENLVKQKSVEEKMVSKLDLDEIKLKQKRQIKYLDNDFDSDSDSEADYSDDSEDKYNIILTKRLPLELDESPQKMHFLNVFSLTTHKRKNQIEFNKYIKRRKLLNQISPENELNEKVEEEEDNRIVDTIDIMKSFVDNKEDTDVLKASQTLPNSIVSEERNIELKLDFMSGIGLCEQKSHEKQREIEFLWNGILNERLMRIKENKCWTKLLNNLTEETLNKWLFCFNSSDNRCNYNGFSIQTTKPINMSSNTNRLNSSRSQRKVVLFGNQSNGSSLHNNQLNKDFVQEFHESVLLETAAKQQQKSYTKHELNNISKEDEEEDNSECFSSDCLQEWPGIEAIMESYDRYSNERKQEKQFLYKRSIELKNKFRNINKESEKLSQQMANLLQLKTHLDEERQRYELLVDTVYGCLKQLS